MSPAFDLSRSGDGRGRGRAGLSGTHRLRRLLVGESDHSGHPFNRALVLVGAGGGCPIAPPTAARAPPRGESHHIAHPFNRASVLVGFAEGCAIGDWGLEIRDWRLGIAPQTALGAGSFDRAQDKLPTKDENRESSWHPTGGWHAP